MSDWNDDEAADQAEAEHCEREQDYEHELAITMALVEREEADAERARRG